MQKYINKTKLKENNYGIKFSGKTEDFINQLREITNDKGYFNLEIKKRKETGKFGDTHYIVVDEYMNDKNKKSDYEEDLPFA